jgi:pyruvate/2-oxoglutarate dehydrogenase complex dihydrolipoamide acyltransferase (E2) component
MIYNVPGKKGVYSTYEMTEPDARKLFGNADSETEDAAAAPAAAPESAPSPAPAPAPMPTAKGMFFRTVPSDKNRKFLESTSVPRRL